MNCTDSACQAQEDNRRGNRIELSALANQVGQTKYHRIFKSLALSLSLHPPGREKPVLLLERKAKAIDNIIWSSSVIQKSFLNIIYVSYFLALLEPESLS
jgi:hypothetical protein